MHVGQGHGGETKFCQLSSLIHLGFSEILFLQVANLPNWPCRIKESINMIGGLLVMFKWLNTYGFVQFQWLNTESSRTCIDAN